MRHLGVATLVIAIILSSLNFASAEVSEDVEVVQILAERAHIGDDQINHYPPLVGDKITIDFEVPGNLSGNVDILIFVYGTQATKNMVELNGVALGTLYVFGVGAGGIFHFHKIPAADLFTGPGNTLRIQTAYLQSEKETRDRDDIIVGPIILVGPKE